MAGYTINKTDNSVLVSDLAENTVDTVAGITLIGRSKANYGEALNENLVKMVEHFANSSAPAESLVGQIWWDNTTELLKVKFQNTGVDATDWKPIGNPVTSSSQPTNPSVGDLWYDTSVGVQQLKLYYNNTWVTIGPENSGGGGTTGLFGDTIDGNIILRLSIAGTDIAIFSNTEFTPSTPIANFPATLIPGINFRRGSEVGEILTKTVSIEENGIFPNTDNVTNLGSTAKKWANVYATNFHGSGANITGVAASSATTAVDATNASKVNITTDSTNTARYVPFVAATTGNNDVTVDTDLTYNPSTNTLSVANITSSGAITATGDVTGDQLISSVAVGTAPLVVTSTTTVTNLSAATADKWNTARSVAFATGDVTGSFSIDGSANVSNVVLTIAPNSVELGTDTTGNYIDNITGTNGITITGVAAEGWEPQVSIGTTSAVQMGSLGVGTDAAAVPAGLGDIRATGDITAFYTSDITWKENISPINNALEKLQQISGVYFDWKDEYIQSRGGEDGYFVRKKDVGVIAQEVEKILPEVVAKKEDGHLAVKYDRLVSLLIESVKELSNEVSQLKQKLYRDNQQ